MTFKHIKFEDSSTMRSLERVAQKKGWFNNESASLFEKTVPSKKNFSVSLNLTENILKLCDGLRGSGLQKYAEELENNFLTYRHAQTIYDTFKEKGEDLVNAAHPEGSHQLKDVKSDNDHNIFETIIDQHLKDLDIVNKTPTGKLSHSQIINLVRTALVPHYLIKNAAPTNEQKENYNTLLDQSSILLNNIAKKLETAPEDQIGITWESIPSIADTLKRWAKVLVTNIKSTVSTGDVRGLAEALDNVKNKLRDKVQIFSEEHQDANRIAIGMIDHVIKNLEKIAWSIQHPEYLPDTTEYQGSTYSKAQPGHHWEAKYLIPGEKKTEQNINLFDISLSEVKNVLNFYANDLQNRIINKEDAVYAPLNDNDPRIPNLDKAFKRAKNLRNQLISFGSSLKSTLGQDKITIEEINETAAKFSMFKSIKYTNKTDLIDRINKIIQTINNAVGIPNAK